MWRIAKPDKQLNRILKKPHVFVTRRIAESALARLRRVASVEVWDGELPPQRRALLAGLARADGALTLLTDRIDAQSIAHSRRLRVISNYAVGIDNIDLASASRAGIAVGHTPGILTETTADLAFALLMAVARRVVEGDRHARSGKWRTWTPTGLLGPDVHGATLGIVGWGAIGRAMARRGAGFGMKILYVRRSRSARTTDDEPLLRDARAVTLTRLLRDADFTSLHVPLTKRTHHLLGARAFARMKRGAIVINTARGAVIDQKAMVSALRSGRLGGVGLDVTDPEPIATRDPLLALPNAVITPHIGSASFATREKMANVAVDNILAVFEGRLPRFCANQAVRLRS